MTTLQPVPNQNTPTQEPALSKTEKSDYEVRCGMCGKAIHVDKETFSFVSEAINAGLDDPFRCETCKEEYDDLVYEG